MTLEANTLEMASENEDIVIIDDRALYDSQSKAGPRLAATSPL